MDRRDTATESGRRAKKKARRASAGQQRSSPTDEVRQAEALASPVEATVAYPDIGMHRHQPSVAYLNSLVDHGLAPRPAALAAGTASNLNFGISPAQRLQLHRDLETAIQGQAWGTTAQSPWPFADQTASALTGMGFSSAHFPQAGAITMRPGMASIQRPMIPSQLLLSGMDPTIVGAYPTTIGVTGLDRTYLDALAMATAFQSHPLSQPAPTMTINQFTTNNTRPLAFVVPQPVVAPSTQTSSGVAESPATALARATSQPPAASAIINPHRASQQGTRPSSSSLPPQGPPQQKNVFPMWCDEDQVSASTYQCLLRRQIEYFVADHHDLQVKAQGRNIPIRLGQVGIRCLHCARVEDAEGSARAVPTAHGGGADVRLNHANAAVAGRSKHRRGAVYYPSKVTTIFQAVQNMATNHFVSGACPNIPLPTLEEIVRLKSLKPNSTRRGEGKGYWARSAAQMGIADADSGETTAGSGLVLLRSQSSSSHRP